MLSIGDDSEHRRTFIACPASTVTSNRRCHCKRNPKDEWGSSGAKADNAPTPEQWMMETTKEKWPLVRPFTNWLVNWRLSVFARARRCSRCTHWAHGHWLPVAIQSLLIFGHAPQARHGLLCDPHRNRALFPLNVAQNLHLQ